MSRTTVPPGMSAIALLSVGVALGGCADRPPASASDPAARMDWVPQARQLAEAVPPRLLKVLREAIDAQGAAGAIGVCSDEAPKLAAQASADTGWQVRRVSLRNRNPKAVPDAWERETLEQFDRAVLAGSGPAALERSAVVVESGQPVRRFMKALPTQQLCLQCHGKPADLAAGVAQRLAQLYPADRGVGYEVGQIRGAMTLRQPVAAASR